MFVTRTLAKNLQLTRLVSWRATRQHFAKHYMRAMLTSTVCIEIIFNQFCLLLVVWCYTGRPTTPPFSSMPQARLEYQLIKPCTEYSVDFHTLCADTCAASGAGLPRLLVRCLAHRAAYKGTYLPLLLGSRVLRASMR